MPAKILVIDDDQDTLKLLKLILENAGFQPLFAENGSRGLTSVQQDRPNLVLCDILMPELDGYETLLAIRSDPDTARLPVLMLSALGQEHDVQRAMAAGANGYVIKPFSVRPLLAEIKAQLAGVKPS